MDRLIEALTAAGGILRVRALLAFAFVGTLCGLFISDPAMIPEGLTALTGTVVGYYFGTREGA